MKIQVLGSGCPTCKKLFEITKTAVRDMGLADDVEYVTDIQQILNMGLMSSPVLAVDGKPAFVGFVPNVEEIKKAILKVAGK
ncbi:MAG: thioredoxin family protein [Candidatus Doudnabacteria bacterium]|nr:thioredoxin family protein [Candidatus Doudnabacteria bacterium]